MFQQANRGNASVKFRNLVVPLLVRLGAEKVFVFGPEIVNDHKIVITANSK